MHTDRDAASVRDAASGRIIGAVRNGARRARSLAWSLGERRPFLTLFTAGALSTLAMAPVHAWPVLLLTLPLWYWTLATAAAGASGRISLGSAFRLGWAFGFGYHFAGLYWIGFSFLVQAERFALLMPFAITGLTAALGLFFGAAAAVFVLCRRRTEGTLHGVILFALTLMAAEWLRGHILTGFPWNVLGYALTMPLPLMQWAGLFGIYGLTAITTITLTVPLVVLASTSQRPIRVIALSTLAPLAFAALYGTWQLARHPTRYHDDVRLRLVQPSFSQKEKFEMAKRWPIFLRHLEMSSTGFDQNGTPVSPAATRHPPPLEPPTHIIWPEAAIPFFVRREPAALAAIDKALPDDVSVIAGTFRIDADPATPAGDIRSYRTFNAAVVIGGNGRVTSIYDKIHLVPFGEYLPLQPLLGALGLENLTRARGGLATGDAPRRLLAIPGLPPTSVLICYEASFPDEIVQGPARPGVLVNLTNDAWFGVTSGPYQHLHQTRLRAVEQGLPLLRSANNGISAIIDPNGRVLQSLALDVVGVIDGRLPRQVPPPLYARFGLWIELALFAALAAVILIATKRRPAPDFGPSPEL